MQLKQNVNQIACSMATVLPLMISYSRSVTSANEITLPLPTDEASCDCEGLEADCARPPWDDTYEEECFGGNSQKEASADPSGDGIHPR